MNKNILRIAILHMSFLVFFSNIFSASRRNYISGNKFRELADYKIDKNFCTFNPASIPEKSIVYCDICFIDYFFSDVFPYINHPIILITHNGDFSAPGKYYSFLDHKNILMWFGQNCDRVHPKFCPIPIGLANYPRWEYGNPEIFDEVLNVLASDLVIEKLDKLYINIALTTSLRNEVYNLFKNQEYALTVDSGGLASGKPLRDFLCDMARSRFVLSPFGGGLDCLRTWEALLVGSIPVVKTSTLDALYQDLPVIIVNDWQEITHEYLTECYDAMKHKTFNYGKLFMDYWVDLIKDFQNSL